MTSSRQNRNAVVRHDHQDEDDDSTSESDTDSYDSLTDADDGPPGMSSFWGMELAAGEKTEFFLDVDESLCISKASFGMEPPKGGRAVVLLEERWPLPPEDMDADYDPSSPDAAYGDGETHPICVLLPGKMECVDLNLELDGPKRYRATVVGEANVTLTGSVMVTDPASDDDDDDDSDVMMYDDDEDEEGEGEKIADYSHTEDSSESDDEHHASPPKRSGPHITEIPEHGTSSETKRETTGNRSGSKTSGKGAKGASTTGAPQQKRRNADVGDDEDENNSELIKKLVRSDASGRRTASGLDSSDESSDDEPVSARAGKRSSDAGGSALKAKKGTPKTPTGVTLTPSSSKKGSSSQTKAIPSQISCHVCSKTFTLQSALEQHLQAKHAS